MSLEENKAKMRRFHEEVLNRGNLSVVDELLTTDFVEHAAPPGTAPGAEGVKQMIMMFRTAFPDLHLTEEDWIAEGDKVVCRYTIRGTHKGEFMGIAPTGKQVVITGIEIVRFEGGKPVEHWEEMDMLGLLQQLGAIPTPGRT
jgi:predicted ester cyclase